MSNQTRERVNCQQGFIMRCVLSLMALVAGLHGANAIAQSTYSFTGSTISSQGAYLVPNGTAVTGTFTVNPALSNATSILPINASNWIANQQFGTFFSIALPASLNQVNFYMKLNVGGTTYPPEIAGPGRVTSAVGGQVVSQLGTNDSQWGGNLQSCVDTNCAQYSYFTLYLLGAPVTLPALPSALWDNNGLLIPAAVMPSGSNSVANGSVSSIGTDGVLNSVSIQVLSVGVATPAIALTKSGSITTFSTAGTAVTYSYQVTNSGNVPLTAVNVADPMVGLSSVSCPSGALASGASETCTATYTITQANVDAGSISNTGTATGTPPSGPNVTATSSVTIPAVQTPAIALVKTANIASYSAPGTPVTYTYKVTNSGNVDLNPVTVTDPMGGLSAISCPNTTLAPAASESCTASYTTTQADLDASSISNTGTATGTPPSGSNVVATSSVSISASDAPSISVVKSASMASFPAASTLVTYTYKVTNTGNVDLNPVTVIDPMGGLSAITCSAAALAPAASLTCSASYTTTAADVTRGSISNTATATGKPQVGASATATSTLTIPYQVPPAFTIATSQVSVSVLQGTTGSLTVATTVSGGFNSPIALTASGLPTGVTASFNPASIAAPGSGSSTLTISVGSAVAPGTYPITVTGTGGALSHSTTLALTIVASSTTRRLTVNPTGFGFGNLPRFSFRSVPITVTNIGTGAVSIQNVSIPPHTGGDVILPLNLCPATLAAGTSCRIVVAIFVTVTGRVTATLVISDNAAGSPQTVSIGVN